MRAAIYFVPPREHPVSVKAAAWLGRDIHRDGPTDAASAPVDSAHAALTKTARRYGFHATIRAPFRLADGRTLEELDAALSAFLANEPPFEIEIEIGMLQSFFAFKPTRPVATLDNLAARIVKAFDPFRAPLTEAEIARRDTSQLSTRQADYLRHWGYPYVFDSFRFHMTLTDSVAEAEQSRVASALRAHFGAAPWRVPFAQLAVAVEASEDAPFVVRSLHPLAASARLTA